MSIFRMVWVVWTVVLCLGLSGCASLMLRPAEERMPSQVLQAVEDGEGCTVVLLPGRFSKPEKFVEKGFLAESVALRPDIELIAADAHLGYYNDKTVVDRLREDVIQPLLDRNREVWLVGTSLGGLGSMIYTRAHPDHVTGAVLLGPFLGREDLVQTLKDAGGPVAWDPSPTLERDTLEGLWLWIADTFGAEDADPPVEIRLGYGDKDRFLDATQVFETLLDPKDVVVAPGGHDWKVWRGLWAEMLERDMICPSS